MRSVFSKPAVMSLGIRAEKLLVRLPLYRDVRRKFRQLGFKQFVSLLPQLISWQIEAFRRAKPTAEERALDRSYGLDTTKWVRAARLEISDDVLPHIHGYEPTPLASLRKLLDSLAINYSDFVFIDVGAGKARALIVAAEYDFKQVVGVEICPHLSETAQRNLEAFETKSGRHFSWTVTNMDAREYPLPVENLVLYLFNPFDSEILGAVRDRLERFVKTHQRKVIIIYNHPTGRSVIDASLIFQVQQQGWRYVIYENYP